MKKNRIKSFLKLIYTPNTNEEFIQQTRKMLPWLSVFLMAAATITTIMNFKRGYFLMACSTISIILIFGICIILNHLKVKIKIITLILSLLFVSQFTLYAITGSNEGFAILWVMLIPALEMGFLDMFWGFLVSVYFQLLLIIMFWTPLRELFTPFYTHAFITRFPVIYFANFSCTLLFFVERHKLQLKKNEFENLLKDEMQKSETLIHAILPEKIAQELKDKHLINNTAIAYDYSDVSILFADIVGFTEISQHFSAKELVDALNNLFSRFDSRAKKNGLEKIKTIGDAYMVASGLPEANEENAINLANFAFGMREDLAEYNKTALIKFEIRIGLNNGPVTAGVIGSTKFIYDVWGDTVNVASRMQSVAKPGTIRISQKFMKRIENKGFSVSSPITELIKNHGEMITYELCEYTH